MSEVLFYHLLRQPLDQVLPQLLEKTLERGWRAIVCSASDERLAALDDRLWTYSDASFLPHGLARDDHAERQPILLSSEPSTVNAADVCFLLDGTAFPTASYRRVVVMFDGNDDDAVAAARITWKAVKGAGHEATYWQQDETGRWQKKA